jgi:outer membrane immunogenic protein
MEMTMKTFYALLACGLAVITANPAFAQADDDQVVPQTPASAFSGARIEASIGWDHFSTKSEKEVDLTQIDSAQTKASSNGVTYGGAIGYDFGLTDHLTLGAELGVYGGSTRLTNTDNVVSGVFNTAGTRIGRDIFLGARLGYVLNPKNLVYGKLGYANTRFGITGSESGDQLYQGIDANGFRLGAGIEHKLTKLTYVKLEYDFSHYGTGQFNYSNATPDASTFDLHGTQQKLLASVGIRF